MVISRVVDGGGLGRRSGQLRFQTKQVVRLGVPDRIVTHGDPKLLMAKYGLDADGIYSKVRETLDIMDEKRLSNKEIKAAR